MSEKKREQLFELIKEKCIVGIGIADEKEIDDINILNATFSAMRRAINEVKEKSDFDIVLVDGNHKIRKYEGEQEAVIKGDSKSLSIAAASIVAKVTRDKMMRECPENFLNTDLIGIKGMQQNYIEKYYLRKVRVNITENLF